MQLTLNIENQNVYNTLVPFLKSIGITMTVNQMLLLGKRIMIKEKVPKNLTKRQD